MRRIALAAALAATLAGGAAALAATPDPAGTDAAPANPYQGGWQLLLDGRPVGPVMNVDGCDLAGQVAATPDPSHKHLVGIAPEPCTFDVGAGMDPAFTNWLNAALQDRPATHDAQLVRSDLRPGYALDLPHAWVAGVSLPRVDRSGTAPAYLRVSLTSDTVRRIPASMTLPPRMRPLVPSSLAVTVGGQPVAAGSVGPWTASIKLATGQGVLREAVPQSVDVGDLPLAVAEPASPTGKVPPADAVATWAQNVLANGRSDERPVDVTLSGVTLALGNTAPDRADLVARADGTRTYDLYADTAGLAVAR